MKRRIVLYLVIPAVLILIAGVVVTQDFFGEQESQLGQGPEAFVASGDTTPTVFVEATIFSATTDPDDVLLELSEAALVTTGAASPLLCLHGLFVSPTDQIVDPDFFPAPPYDAQSGRNDAFAYALEPPLCNFETGEQGEVIRSDGVSSDLLDGSGEPLALFLEEGDWATRFYPFDRRQGQWDIYPLVLTPDGEPQVDTPIRLHLTTQLADWQETLDLRPSVLQFAGDLDTTINWSSDRLTIALQRTPTQRLLTVTLLGFLTLLILGLLLVKEKQTLLEVVIGILLGLWGIQAVLLPNYIQNSTLVHYWIIILYILLGLVAYVRLVGLPLVRGVDAADALDSLDDELEPLPEDEDEERPV